MRIMISAIILLFSVLFSQDTDSTTQKLPIAILTLDAKGITQQEADILTERLRTAFVQDGRYQVVERSQMESILTEQGFQQMGCTTNECLVQAGLILGVQEMVGGSVGKIGERYAIDVRLFDIESTKIIKAVSRNVHGSVDQLLDVMPEISEELSNSLTPIARKNGHYRSEKVLLTDRDIENGIEAVGEAIEFAAERVSESLESAGISTGNLIDRKYDSATGEYPDFTKGKKEGIFAAQNEKWKDVWLGIPAGMGFVSAVNNGLFPGLITGWITKKIQLGLEGKPVVSNPLQQKIKDESLDYREGFREGYIKEQEKIRNRRMDVGCWAGALVGFLLF
ncbi:MAG: hypothetical protein HQ509_09980 [Candidatus Marinimicrobia bacterium]|nr:hypothetical protein [Candidatus Neomarinimicrobiota bacterium]